MRLHEGDKVRYIGGDDMAYTYRGHADPRGVLVPDATYTLAKVVVGDWWTDYWLVADDNLGTWPKAVAQFDGDGRRGFNSVLFEYVEDWAGTKNAGYSIRSLVQDSYQIAYEHGFWNDANYTPQGPDEAGTGPAPVPLKYVLSTKLALIHSEVTEALEEIRDAVGYDLASLREVRYTESGKPEGFGPELADAFIRIADLAGYLGIDLEAVVIEKAAYNRGRPFMHGRSI